MALVRVYCGLASADDTARPASAALLTIAVVDDAGRLLGVHEVSDDPSGYAALGTLLVERTSGFAEAAVAADSDDHLITSLLSAAGRPLVVTDDDSTDDFAERFADDDSVEEMQAPPAARRAVGLARALQAGAIVATNLPTPRDLVSYKPILAAHVALLNGRHSAAAALREVLRELYPAALRAYPDPAHPLALAVLDALPEPSRLAVPGLESQRAAEQVAAELTRNGSGNEDEIIAAVTALSVAISESPRRGGVNKSLAPVAARSIRQAVAAVRACDTACAELLGTLADRSAPVGLGQGVIRRGTRRAPEAPPLQPVAADDTSRYARRGRPDPAPLQPVSSNDSSRYARRSRPEPATAGSGPATPQPMTTPPVAPDPVMPPPLAPRPVTPPPMAPAAAAFGNRAPAPANRPVSVPPPPPGMTPITPGARPVPSSRNPAAPTSAPAAPAASLGSTRPLSPSPLPSSSVSPSPLPSSSVSPADNGQPFRATLTNAAINSVRAERQRTVIPARPSTARPAPAPGSVTDFSLPMPAPRPGQEVAEPASRANWPLLNSGDEAASTAPISAPPASAPPVESRHQPDGRVRPPWQDMPNEPPPLRLVEPKLGNSLDTTVPDLAAMGEPPPLRLVDNDDRNARGARAPRRPSNGTPSPASSTGTKLTALDRSTTPPVPAESNDGDLLIFAAARSAWFTGQDDDSTDRDWTNPNDTGWRAAEKAATPAVAAETAAGLPKRVPQANLVPGSPLRDERPLRIVRDAASIAAHTTGYFRGWRRGQEIGGFAMGGRPGRDSAGGWDFTRDGQSADDYRNTNAGYRSS